MKYFILAIKVLVILGVLSAGYYFGYLKPHQTKVKEISVHYSNLVRNRMAHISLAKLDTEKPDFDIQKSNLVDIIRQTNAKGLENPLSAEEKRIFERQNEILTKVFATASYEEGVVILKSEESIDFLTDETKLIEEYRNNMRNR